MNTFVALEDLGKGVTFWFPTASVGEIPKLQTLLQKDHNYDHPIASGREERQLIVFCHYRQNVYKEIEKIYFYKKFKMNSW